MVMGTRNETWYGHVCEVNAENVTLKANGFKKHEGRVFGP